MYGIPKVLNTRADYERCHDLAVAGLVDKAAMARRWRALQSGAQCYIFDRELADGESSDGSEPDYKVMAPAEDGELRQQFRLVDNPDSRMATLGLTVAEIDIKISELEAE